MLRAQGQGSISGKRRCAGMALAFAILLAPVIFVTQPAQAQIYQIVYSFDYDNPINGRSPHGGLIHDPAGNLYGTTAQGGHSGGGVVFKLDTAGVLTVLHNFSGLDGEQPFGGLIRGPNGVLYGTSAYGDGPDYKGNVFQLNPESRSFKSLYTFHGADGAYPFSGLVRDGRGNLYGTTTQGGDLACHAPWGCGVVFELDKTGTLTVLHSFNGADGEYPVGGLIHDAKGNLYGTTDEGGAYGYGTVFQLDTAGTLTVLYSFNNTDGAGPFGDLINDAAGNLYGTTTRGGDLTCNAPSGCGIVFELDKAGALTILHTFNDAEGAFPLAGLAPDSEGILYGTTENGGAFSDRGTVFKLDPATGRFTVLHNFGHSSGTGTDGAYPSATLMRDAAGNFYGTTSSGGGKLGPGTIFRISPR